MYLYLCICCCFNIYAYIYIQNTEPTEKGKLPFVLCKQKTQVCSPGRQTINGIDVCCVSKRAHLLDVIGRRGVQLVHHNQQRCLSPVAFGNQKELHIHSTLNKEIKR